MLTALSLSYYRIPETEVRGVLGNFYRPPRPQLPSQYQHIFYHRFYKFSRLLGKDSPSNYELDRSSKTPVVLFGRLGSKDRLFFERFKMLRKKKIVLEAL